MPQIHIFDSENDLKLGELAPEESVPNRLDVLKFGRSTYRVLEVIRSYKTTYELDVVALQVKKINLQPARPQARPRAVTTAMPSFESHSDSGLIASTRYGNSWDEEDDEEENEQDY